MDVVPGDVIGMNKHLVDYGFEKEKKKTGPHTKCTIIIFQPAYETDD